MEPDVNLRGKVCCLAKMPAAKMACQPLPQHTSPPPNNKQVGVRAAGTGKGMKASAPDETALQQPVHLLHV